MTAGQSATSLDSPCGIHSLPDEIVAKILFSASTPTFLQLLQTSKSLFFRIAQNDRRVLLHHLNAIPGDKELLAEHYLSNEQLCLLLRQRAANHLFGANFSANMTEYTNVNVKPDAQVSAVSGLDADYVRMALTFENTNDIRQYTNHCQIKEKLEQRQDGRMIKLVQWSRIVSVLHAVNEPVEEGCTEALPSDVSESEADMLLDRPFVSKTNLRLTQYQQEANKSRRKKKIRGLKGVGQRVSKYRVTHFDIYATEDSRTYFVLPPDGYVPRDFVVQTFTQFAILWDRPRSSNRPSEHAKVIVYTVRPIENESIIETETRVVWPKAKPHTADADSDSDEAPENLPETISFFKDGRRIKMYEAGGVVPYQVFSTSTTQHDPYGPTNVINFTEFSFHVDTPFFGQHVTYDEDLSCPSFCSTSYLCLGVTTLDVGEGDNEDEVRVLCILKSLTTAPSEACDHHVSLSRLPHLGAHNTTVVARLWGWEELHTNLSGKDTVAVSSGGTRIAIAMWDKVYIYALNPKVLCDENVVDGSDHENSKQKKKKKKPRRPWNIPTSNYYNRCKDSNLMDWRVAVLRPVILDLEGAVAQKMSWSPAKGKITDTADPEPSNDEIEDIAQREPDVACNTDHTTQNDHGTHTIPSDLVAPLESAPHDVQSSPESPDPFIQPEMGSTGTTPEVVIDLAVEENELTHSEAGSTGSSVLLTTASQIGNTTMPPNQKATDEETPQQIPACLDPLSEQTPYSALVAQEGETDTSVQLNNVMSTEQLSASSPSPIAPSTPFIPIDSNAMSKPKTLTRKEKIFNSSVIDHPQSKQASPYLQQCSKAQSDIQTASTANKSPVSKAKQMGNDPMTPTTSIANPASKPGSPEIPSHPLNSNIAMTAVAGPSEQKKELINEDGGASLKTHIEATSKAKDTNDELTTSASLSKTSQAIDLDSKQAGDTRQGYEDASVESVPAATEPKVEKPRRKRVTEDELIILTDRGIQIWNLGASARGVRRRKVLPLEESLAGRLPVRKEKHRDA